MFILVFIIVFGDLVYETRALCPASSFTNPDSGICYWYNPSLVTATACNTSCVLNGGIIGEIPDENSQLFLMQHFQSVGVTGGIWVGVNDIDAELNFRTWDGYPQSYFNWRLGQPNGYPLDAGATEQDCMAMFTTDNFRWQDKPCGDNYMCLCSYRSCKLKIIIAI
ncbi:hypothetical protein KUTeg_024940 [Tegillarca granosa]|uniref:C-type lectin domain-containing protein n=1 Tax=Tegillarca granosa TaxID=220873 RepID=A0ABQ9E2P2_TEGGR|nr:hypothetical protein KUTeg_024940 [Tegillarca granosa]